jgi:hypothetical protein
MERACGAEGEGVLGVCGAGGGRVGVEGCAVGCLINLMAGREEWGEGWGSLDDTLEFITVLESDARFWREDWDAGELERRGRGEVRRGKCLGFFFS